MSFKFLNSLLFPEINFSEKQLTNVLKNKTILITGASFGIGEALAKSLLVYDVHLILIARTEEKLNQIKSLSIHNNAKVSVYKVDLCNVHSIDNFYNDLVNQKIKPDVIINNAGKSVKRSLWDFKDKFYSIENSIKLNYLAPIHLILKFVSRIESQNIHILNISSLTVLLPPFPLWSAYHSSKGAFDIWFKCVESELENAKIKFSTIYLPLVNTRMITPSQEYKNMPAMSVGHVSDIVKCMLISKNKNWLPWWFGLVKALIFVFTPLMFLVKKIYLKYIYASNKIVS